MFIAKVVSKGKNGKSYTSILLRQSVRVGSKVKSKTLAVLTHLPAHVLAAVERAVSQPACSLAELAEGSGGELQLRNELSFGAVWALDQLGQRLGIRKAFGDGRQAQLGYWQVLAKVLRSKISLLGMARLAGGCAAAEVLGLDKGFNEDDLYRNGSWVAERQGLIEQRLWEGRGDRSDRELFLYDVTSSYLEGECNPFGAWGYSRDGKEGKKQVVIGLLTDGQGEPVSVQVYAGNTSDLKTFGEQVHKLKERFGCEGVTLVGDRGMIKSDQKREALEAGFHFISALTKRQIEKLLADGVIQLGLFDEEVAEVVSGDGRRYVLRRNPVVQAEMRETRQRKRLWMEQAVKKANEYLVGHPKAKVETQLVQLGGKLKELRIGGWAGLKAEGRRLELTVDEAELEEESRLDGCYVIETDLEAGRVDAQTVHDRYKDLALIERDFRRLKTDLELRPWFVWTEDNTRVHAFIAMLALKLYRYLERAWSGINVTVDEGLRSLEQICVMELVHEASGEVIARRVPGPNQQQKQLLDALGLSLPTRVAKAEAKVVTRKKIAGKRKTI